MEDSSSTHFGCLHLIGRSVIGMFGMWQLVKIGSGLIFKSFYFCLAISDGMRFQDAREESMDLNAVIWGALLDACSKSFAWRRASQLLVLGLVISVLLCSLFVLGRNSTYYETGITQFILEYVQ